MDERRKRKPMWGMEEETKHLSGTSENSSWMGSGHYHELSESRTTTTQKSRDNSGWPTWESIEENPTEPMNTSFKNAPEGKERGGGKRYYDDVSPGFDGVELRSHDHTREYDQSHSQRYLGRGRSRSRSRARGRSRSPSPSRGRERERERERGSDRGRERRRDWSRSRSRSRTDGNARHYTRSRSPIRDPRRQSYELSDRRSGPEKSSQICRDLASGRCKRGSQCRFFHPRRDGGHMEDDTTESWRSRAADRSRIPRHSYDRGSRNDVSDPYYREEDQFVSRSRGAPPCKDFIRGDCTWGESCRFSHDGLGQKTRNASFDKDIDREPYKSVKPLCKYFAAGKCGKDNCWFSHENPNLDKVEARRGGDVTESRSPRYKSNRRSSPTWDDEPRISDRRNHIGRSEPIANTDDLNYKDNKWNGPTWDDATRNSDTLKHTGWGEPIVANATNTDNSHDDLNLSKVEGRQGDVTDTRSSHYKTDTWNGPKWEDPTRISEKPPGFGEPILATDNSHEEPSRAKAKGRRDEVIDSRSSHYKSNMWNGPTWDDATGVSDTLNPTGWGEPNRAKTTHTDDSYEDPDRNKVKSRRDEVTGGRSSHDKSSRWNGPTRGDATGISDTPKSTGWGEPILAKATHTDDSYEDRNPSNVKGRRGEAIDNRSSHHKSNRWNGPMWDDATGVSDTLQPSGWGEPIPAIATNTVHSDWREGTGISVNSEKQPSLPVESVSYGHGQDALLENQDFAIKALQQKYFPASSIQQQHGTALENNQTNTFGSDVPAEQKEVRYTTDPILFSGQTFNQNDGNNVAGNLISHEGQNIFCPDPSNGLITDLNGPDTHTVGQMDVQTQIINNRKAVQSSGLLDAKVLQLLTSEQRSNTGTNSPVTNAGQQVPPSPLVKESVVRPNPGAASFDLSHSMGHDRDNTEKRNLAQGTEQKNQMQLKLSSPFPVVSTGVDRLNVKHPQSPRPRQEEAVPNSENAIGDQNKSGLENKPSENLDGMNKDEKALFIFKNALVEFVKELLKPAWKEGRMSRDAHKTVVKKVVDKVSGAIPVDHIPKTQDKVDQYLSVSKPKIAKLVQAYVERSQKADP
ncbi:hypothetical protein ABFX02_03G091400 [Erythranthe guttata]